MSAKADETLEEAMDWLMRLRDAPADATLRADLDSWLARDFRHARAWSQASEAWRLIGDVLPEPSPKIDPFRKRPLARVAAGLAALAVAAGLVLTVAPGLSLRLRADQVTATAETRQVALEDGSIVHLGPQSAVKTHFTDKRRDVMLLAGEAFFEVAPNPARPFVVEADGLRTEVLGTAFDVRLALSAVSVEVAHGLVGVRYESGDELRLAAGERMTFERDGGFAERRRVAPDDVGAWRDGKLFVVDTAIGEVIEEIRRYSPGWVVLADSSLAAERVTGLYDLRDPARALRALVQPVGGSVRSVTPLVQIVSRS